MPPDKALVGDRKLAPGDAPDGVTAVRDWQATNAAILRTALLSLHPAWQQLLIAALPALRELIRAIEAIPAVPDRDAEPEAAPGPYASDS